MCDTAWARLHSTYYDRHRPFGVTSHKSVYVLGMELYYFTFADEICQSPERVYKNSDT